MMEELLKDKAISFEFFRSSGPGGQNVNKVSSAVRLRFDLKISDTLSETTATRLAKIAGRKMTEDQVILIEAQRFRTQERNREDSLNRLIAMIEKAMEEPKIRIPTKPTATAEQRRLDNKKHRAKIKMKRGVSDL